MYKTDQAQRDHGGNLDAAIARYGGARADWLDLSTGINPVPYPVPEVASDAWACLPDRAALEGLTAAARDFWRVPEGFSVLAAPGASALIAQIPRLAAPGRVAIPGPTYNEHSASFSAAGWTVAADASDAKVMVHPNNPDGRVWSKADLAAGLNVVDESFCDVMPDASFVPKSLEDRTIILKSFGKFWGLAGLRLGFAIGPQAQLAELGAMLGPWAVSGPALQVGTAALRDVAWARDTRARLARDAARLDQVMTRKGAAVVGGTTLFRLYRVTDAQQMQDRLAQARVWSRVFPYDGEWLRLGLPPETGWDRIAGA
ncbi:MAG: threonine-phosphate decarboxylase [Pseudomonadota bacterium]